MQVRLKLDTCGIKLKLPQWHQLSAQQRQQLVTLPCNTEAETQHYRSLLQQWVLQLTGESATQLAIDPHPAWQDCTAIADSVVKKAQDFGVNLQLRQWAALTSEQRFALFKLSRSNHENRNFLPALKEFQITW